MKMTIRHLTLRLSTLEAGRFWDDTNCEIHLRFWALVQIPRACIMAGGHFPLTHLQRMQFTYCGGKFHRLFAPFS
jgi:hypothetical protein